MSTTRQSAPTHPPAASVAREAKRRPNHLHITVATARRILRQLAHDRRSIAMIMVVPVVLLTLIYFMYRDQPHPPGQPRVFDNVGVVILGFFPFFILFIVTSITMLRERTSGTLERLLTTPIAKGDLLAGYAIAFSLLALVQVTVMTAFALWVYDLDVRGSLWLLFLMALADALLGVALGLFVSAFARTEFQAVQFVPALIVPQTLLCGLFTPRHQMVHWMSVLSDYLPVTYAVQGMQEVARHSVVSQSYWNSLIVVGIVSVACLALGAATLRRRTR